ncbi:hypothetical protein LTR56_019979 [Elasticomyces elasticus]|nr:hypothetical protein LTR56_019979 [Elasticomyces elasticus]KAK3634088.1 hypothetical protein LTR22_019820 [Elasticomyces elasticus]KAK4911173.1 hypothetical protein LTR49_020245 [Elasticomyces elasticus]KAK5748010.1 hypothetical protein LTS12_021939 [Elasticomyces elasticus]
MATGPCLLLDLPPELRNTIWELVLADDDPGKGHIAHITSQGRLAVPAILRANEQTRRETLPMWYENTHFYTTIRGSVDVESCPNRLALIGDLAARHIRHVKIQTRSYARYSNWADIDLDLGAVESVPMVQARRWYKNARIPGRIEQRLRDLVLPLSVKRAKKEITAADWQALLQASLPQRNHHKSTSKDHSSQSATSLLIAKATTLTSSTSTSTIAMRPRKKKSEAPRAAVRKVDKRCHLLALPPELRNSIYVMVFEEGPYIQITRRGHLKPMHALPHVNRQVRNESLGLWYANSTFALYDLSWNFGPDKYHLWLDSLGGKTTQDVRRIAIYAPFRRNDKGAWTLTATRFRLDIDLGAQHVDEAVQCQNERYTLRIQPRFKQSLGKFREEIFAHVQTWQAGNGKRHGIAEWRLLLKSIRTTQSKYSPTTNR